jgi:putative nucleotidyltransferase with HDIG domain
MEETETVSQSYNMAISTGWTGRLLVERPYSLNMQRRLGVNLIFALGQTLGRSLPSHIFWERLAQYAAALTQAPYSQILTLDGKNLFSSMAIYGSARPGMYKYPDVTPARRYFYEVQRRGTVLSLKRGDNGIDAICAHALGLDVTMRIWMVPMKVGQEFVGILILGEGSPGKIMDRTGEENDRLELMSAIADLIANTVFRARYHPTIEDIYLDVLIGLAKTLDGNDPYMEHHADRTAILVKEIAGQLGYSEAELAALRWAGLLHDIGKIGIPEEILTKPGPLTPYEWFIIKQHPVLGSEFLTPVLSLAGVAPVVRAHHEHYDGTGYPDGLSGGAIPLGARILAVADAYTCMTDGRPYRQPFCREEAAAELVRCQGSQFDPVVIQAFMSLFNQRIL